MGKMCSLDELSPAIIQAIERGATIITGNQRSARWLRHAYDRRQRALGNSVWSSVDILAWDSWTAKIWHDLLLEGHESFTLLSATQEQMLWHSVISDDRKNLHSLRSVRSLVEQAASAWLLVAQYRAEAYLKNIAASFETRSYLRWAEEFKRRCGIGQWITAAQLEGRLLVAAQSSLLPIRELFLVGFDDLTPARRVLIDALTQTDHPVKEEPLPSTGALFCVAAEDEIEEINAAARWARNSVQQSRKSIAIIVPSLASKRALIDRIFRQTLAPELENIAEQDQLPPYEFSVGISLAHAPLVSVALDLLHWALQPLPVEKVSALLVSPLFAMGEADAQGRAIFDAFDLRQAKMLLKPQVSIGWLLAKNMQARRRALPPRLVNALEALLRSATRYGTGTEERGFVQWADIFRDLLRQAQWQDSRLDSSTEFQVRKRWESSLDELASLDFIGRRSNYGEALDFLERIVQSTIFAPESHQAPVQILGPLEAAGVSFDAIWFLGAGDLTWPIRHTYNPLLPAALQRQLGMPGEITADQSRDLAISRRICSSAASIIFSFPAAAESVRMRLSQVISVHRPEMVAMSSIAPPDPEPDILSLEILEDTGAPPIATDRTIPGGAEILRLQAACGFRAFAEKRLYSAELKKKFLGMDVMERGTVVHSALEAIWREIVDQKNLLAMSPEQRGHAIDRAVDESIRRHRPQSPAEWELAYIDVQRVRLKALIANWLEVESERRPFEVRLSEKEFKDVAIGPLHLSVRVDRVDHTAAGDVIIDYKTGSAKPSDWMSDRPDAPQLPLYGVISSSLHSDARLADIAFAKVHAGNDAILDGYTGKTDSGGWIPGRDRLPLAEQLQQWKSVLTNLAEDFHQGDARVDPKSYPHSCRYCAQRLLCRLDPTLLDVDEEANDAP